MIAVLKQYVIRVRCVGLAHLRQNVLVHLILSLDQNGRLGIFLAVDGYRKAINKVLVFMRYARVDAAVGGVSVTSVCELSLANLDSCVVNTDTTGMHAAITPPHRGQIVDVDEDRQLEGPVHSWRGLSNRVRVRPR